MEYNIEPIPYLTIYALWIVLYQLINKVIFYSYFIIGISHYYYTDTNRFFSFVYTVQSVLTISEIILNSILAVLA